MACAVHLVPSALNDWLIERRTTLQAAGLAVDGEAALHLLDGVLLASDFAFDALRRDPALWPLAQRDLPPPPLLAPDNIEHWPGQLRRYRIAGSLAMIVAAVAHPHAIDPVLPPPPHTAEPPIPA